MKNTTKRIQFSTSIGLLLFGLAETSIRADLVSVDDSRYGKDSLIVDTRTGLAWLDLCYTVNLSYSQTEAASQPPNFLSGFRHATSSEVKSLFSSAGLVEGFIAESSPGYQSASSLISLVNSAPGITEIIGITGTRIDEGDLKWVVPAAITSAYVDGKHGYYVQNSPNWRFGLDATFPSVGNWMVATPEPSVLALAFIGTAIVVVSFRRTS